MNPIPITVFTGFLGAGKTTFINEIVKQNPNLKFGFIINEFGKEGIDGQLIQNATEEIVELSNGCLCCVVRSDLLKSVEALINTGKVNYIIIETSGLAEPLPIAQTFYGNSLGGRIILDGIICLVDCENFNLLQENKNISHEQIEGSDIIILNKIEKISEENLNSIISYIQNLNPYAPLIKNSDSIDSKIIIDTGKFNPEKLNNYSEHDHGHDEIDEVIFSTPKFFDIKKLDKWLETKFPLNAIRAKGFLNVKGYSNEDILCLLQVVGAKKEFRKFIPIRENFDSSTSRIVFIGSDLRQIQEEIFKGLEETLV